MTEQKEYIRTEVMAFAEAMETTLRKHDDKGGWEDCGLHWLLERVQGELKEALKKWDAKNFRGDYNAVSEELIDVANFCMMFWGNTQRYYNRPINSHPYNDKPRPPCEECIYQARDVVFSLVFKLPSHYPSIKKRQLAFKDFEDEDGESWCSLSNSPLLEEGDIIQIVRRKKP